MLIPSATGASRYVVAALAGLAAFAVYARTLSASIAWGDSPELTTAAFNAGIPHPTGYPLYMMLAHAFLRVCPLGSIATRMNLLSAISAGAAMALLYLLMRRFLRSRTLSLIATLAFAYSVEFWSQAVIAEVYAFHMLLMTAVLGAVLAWDTRGERRWLLTSALLYGISFTHHMMSVLLLPGLLYFAFTSRHRPQFLRELRWTLPLFLLPLSLYIYLPLAALRDPPANWGDPRNWHNFWAHISGKQYHAAMFSATSPLSPMTRARLLAHVKDYTGIGLKGSAGFLRAQFGPGFFWLAPLGAWSLARRRRRLFGLTLLIYLADVIYALNYYVFDVDVFYLPSHMMVAIWLGCGLRQVQLWLRLLWRKMALQPASRKPLNVTFGAALLIVPISLLTRNWELNDHHKDWSALMYARAALDTLKPHAVLLGGGDNFYFPLMYTRFVEQRRPDVTMLSFNDALYPERVRMITRLRAEGLRVRVPPHFGAEGVGSRVSGVGSAPGPVPYTLHPTPYTREDGRLVKSVVDDNVGRRPVFMLGPPESLRMPWMAAILAPYYRIVSSNVPTMEISRHAPPLAVASPHPERPKRVKFGLSQPGGGMENDLELLGCDVSATRTAGVPWLRVSYYWRVHNQALARPAQVWVIFTDAAGNYPHKADGSPDFHNSHPLAYGVGQGAQGLPKTLRETYNLYVPPSEWNKRLYLRLAVALGQTLLPTDAGRSPWVELGRVR